MEMKDILALIGAGVAIVISIVALWSSWRQAREQANLEIELAAKDAELQRSIRDEVARSDKRRFFSTTLWDRMIGVSDIDPADPVGPDIRKAVNLLEAVAMSWEADIVDRQMVLVSFGHLYNDLYDKVKRTNVVPEAADGSGPSGSALLNSNPFIEKINNQIIEEFQKRSAIAM